MSTKAMVSEIESIISLLQASVNSNINNSKQQPNISSTFSDEKSETKTELSAISYDLNKGRIPGTLPNDTSMDINHRICIAQSVGEECITTQQLKTLLSNKQTRPIAYDGFEPSGRMHIAQGILKAINVNKLTSIGCDFVFWVADWFALLNNKMGGNIDHIKLVGKYMIEVWKSAGMNMDNVYFRWCSDDINKNSNQYWLRVIEISKLFTIKQTKRCCTILGREQSDDMPTANLLYACMQCADIFFLKANICQLGMDQRKVNIFARIYAQKLMASKKKKKKKGKKEAPIHPPVIISHHMLMGLTQYANEEKSEQKWNEWNCEEIMQWIVSLGKDKKIFKQYEKILMEALNEEEISGECMRDINIKDIERWGISNIGHAQILMKHIKWLINIDYEKWNVNQLVEWIVELNPEIYGKYKQILIKTLSAENINGLSIKTKVNDDTKPLEVKDIKRWGVKNFKHSKLLFRNIRLLVENNKGQKNSDIIKMSKSDPNSAIFMEDTANDVKKKIKAAYCPPGVIEKNPILDYTKHIVFGKYDTFVIERKQEYGGNMVYKSYDELEQDYVNLKLHPDDLKKALTKSINKMLEPVRRHFQNDKNAKRLLKQIKNLKITK